MNEKELRSAIGEKWASLWWRKPQYAKYHEMFGPRLNDAMQKVSEVFNEDWARHAVGHPMSSDVFSEGTLPLANLFSLGDEIITLEDSKNLKRVISEIRHGRTFHSAYLELQLAAQLRRCSHTIEFRPAVTGGREADFLAKLDPQVTYFEIKRLEEPEECLYMGATSRHLIFVLGQLQTELVDRGWGYRIELHSETTMRITRAVDDLRMAILLEVGEQVREAIAAAAATADHQELIVPGVANITVGPGIDITIGYQPFKPAEHETRRIMARLVDGAGQLDPSHPGIIAIQTPQALAETVVQEISTLLDLDGFRHVVAVLVFPVTYALSVPWTKFPPFYIAKDRPRLPAIIVCAFSDLLPLFENRAMTVSEFYEMKESEGI